MYMTRLMKLIGYEDYSIPYRKLCLCENAYEYESFNAVIKNDKETKLENDDEINDRLNNPMEYATKIINKLVELRESEDNEKFDIINKLFDLYNNNSVGENVHESFDDNYDDERRSLFYKAIEKVLQNILFECNRKEEIFTNVNEAVDKLMTRKDGVSDGYTRYIGHKVILIIEAVCVSID